MYDITLKINARLQPIDRGDEYEDPIGEALENRGLGEVTGGGTMLESTGEVKYCEVDLFLEDGSEQTMEALLQILDEIGVPKGSVLQWEGHKHPVGRLEGMGFYANGTELPLEVYQNCDINVVIREMESLMEGVGRFYSYWEGPEDTALYFYGTSFEEMRGRIEKFVEEYPLCHKSRIVRIA